MCSEQLVLQLASALRCSPGDASSPEALRWRRQTLRLVRAEGPERIAAEWWVGASRPGPQDVRDYWRVEDDLGRRLWVFRQDDAWFVHGVLP